MELQSEKPKAIIKKFPFPKNQEQLRAGLYNRRFLVPNAVTVGNMFCGFLAIMYATSGRFEKAFIAILIAILLDGLDGRVARKLNATSKFGVEFDSFSDLISFGVAPAILVYNWSFNQDHLADEFGVFVCFLFAVCSACRLARFNIEEGSTTKFTGLPTPGAAGAVAGVVNFMPDVGASYYTIILTTILMLSLGYLMVSTITYLSIKTLKIGSLKIKETLGIAILMGITWYNSRFGLLILGVGYAYSGVLMMLWERFGGKKEQISNS